MHEGETPRGCSSQPAPPLTFAGGRARSKARNQVTAARFQAAKVWKSRGSFSRATAKVQSRAFKLHATEHFPCLKGL